MAEAKTKFPKFTYRSVRTPVATARHAYLDKPDDYQGKKQFKVTAVFDGDTDLEPLRAAALATAAEAFPGRKVDKVNVLIKDGDDATDKDGNPDTALAGKMFLTTKCGEDHPPLLIGPDRKPLPPKIRIFGGDKIKLVLTPLPSDLPVKGSITFRLIAVQLIEKSQFGGGGDAASLFEDEGEGFGSGVGNTEASGGMDSGEDDDLPF